MAYRPHDNISDTHKFWVYHHKFSEIITFVPVNSLSLWVCHQTAIMFDTTTVKVDNLASKYFMFSQNDPMDSKKKFYRFWMEYI